VIAPQFQSLLRLPSGRYGSAAAVSGDSIYVIGGADKNGFLGEVVRITPKTGEVKLVSNILEKRRYLTAESQGPFLYILGGFSNRGEIGLVERFDTRSGKVEKMAPLPTPRSFAASVLIDDNIWVLGGSRGNRPVGVVEIYNIPTNTWSKGYPLPIPCQTDAVYRNGVIYTVGGYDGQKALPVVQAYSVSNAKWNPMRPLPRPTSAHHAVMAGNTIYIFGDYTDRDRVTVLDVVTQSGRIVPDTGYQASRHNAAVLFQNSIYVIGGNTGSNGSYLNLIQQISI
jgi:N-acetylneuraminic acid mutarotase